MSNKAWPVSLSEISHTLFSTDQAPAGPGQDTCCPPASWQQAQELLCNWSADQWTRKTPLFLCSSDPEALVKLWCAHVFKRGLETVTWDGKALGPAQPQDQSTPDTLIMSPTFLSSWEVLRLIADDLGQGDTLCILDEGFAKHWPDFAHLAAPSNRVIRYQPSESTKRLETIAHWAQHANPRTLRRVWSVGGGITSDLGGFFAGLFGLEHSTCPTTLLSAYDASLGGKTGANLPPWGKNQVGLFYPTKRWVIAPEHFRTLPKQEILCAVAEGLKHVWLAGHAGQAERARMEKLLTDLSASSEAPLPHEWVTVSVLFHYSIKASLVRADPYETGPRAALNLGHTIAHVLEALADEGWIGPIPHGLAVAVGMRCLLAFNWLHDTSQTFEALLDNLLRQGGCVLPLRINPSQATRFQDRAQPRDFHSDTGEERAELPSPVLAEDHLWGRFEHLARSDKKQGVTVNPSTDHHPDPGHTLKNTSLPQVNFVVPRFGFAESFLSGAVSPDYPTLTQALFRKVPLAELIKRCRELPLLTL